MNLGATTKKTDRLSHQPLGEKLSFLVSQQTGASVLFTQGPKKVFLELGDDEAGAGMGGSSVQQEALSGHLVGLPAASSQDLPRMRRLKAAEHRLMLWKELLGFHAQH